MTLQNKTTTQRLKSADDGIDELVLGSRYDDESAEAAVEPQVESTGAKALVVEEETEEIVVGEADKGSAVPAVEQRFAYAGIERSVADEISKTADRIRELHCSIIEHMIAVGKDLIIVKEKLDHGQFGPWLEAEFGWSERTAQNYMAVADKFGDIPDIARQFQPTTLYRLAAKSTPSAMRKKIVDEVRDGKAPTSGEVAQRIDEAIEQERLQKEEAAKDADKTLEQTEAHKKQEQKKADKLARDNEKRQRALEGEKKLAAELVLLLQKRLGHEFLKFREDLKGVSLLAFMDAVRNVEEVVTANQGPENRATT